MSGLKANKGEHAQKSKQNPRSMKSTRKFKKHTHTRKHRGKCQGLIRDEDELKTKEGKTQDEILQ